MDGKERRQVKIGTKLFLASEGTNLQQGAGLAQSLAFSHKTNNHGRPFDTGFSRIGIQAHLR